MSATPKKPAKAMKRGSTAQLSTDAAAAQLLMTPYHTRATRSYCYVLGSLFKHNTYVLGAEDSHAKSGTAVLTNSLSIMLARIPVWPLTTPIITQR